MTRLETALVQIKAARDYTKWMIADLGDADWFRTPSEGVTHVAWQVGHIAIAQYRLLLAQLRGVQPEDERFIPADYVARFGRGSTPSTDASIYPPPTQLRIVLDAVHEHALVELATFPDQRLDLPPEREHQICKTKMDCVRGARCTRWSTPARSDC